MRYRYWMMAVILLWISHTVSAQHNGNRKTKKTVYEEVDFEDMIHRYFGKEKSEPLEGIYSVSCIISQTKKRFLGKRERIKIVARKDNYARVAILQDWPGSARDFIEVSLSYRDAKKYPVVGELNLLSEGKGLIYKHLEPNGTNITFSMMRESDEILEAEYAEMRRSSTITYSLSYLKIYPKQHSLIVTR